MAFFSKKTFDDLEQAKQFLIGKIELESSAQGNPLNADEKRALNYAGDEPSTGWGLDWAKVRGADNDEGEEFERLMVSLLSAAYQRDKYAGVEDAKRYREAQRMLSNCQATNWIVSIAEQALANRGIFG